MTDEPYDPRKMRTPVPRKPDGTIDWRLTIIGALTVLGLLGGGGAAAIPMLSGGNEEKIAKLEAQIEEQREKQLEAILARLTKVEEELQRTNKYMARVGAKLGVK